MTTPQRLTPEDLAGLIGTCIGTSSWFTLDQPRISAFAECTDDRQWIHVDEERARRESPFGGTVAHGFLTLSLLAPACFEILAQRIAMRQAVNYGLEKVRFISPVRAGRRVRNHITIQSIEPRGDNRYLLTTENVMEIEGEEKPALQALSQAMLMV